MTESLSSRVQRRFIADANRPFIVSIMGQTGVGKTSLVNALFNAKLPTSPWQPTTKIVKPFHVHGTDGGVLTFYDLPGLGEPGDVDGRYLDDYKKYLLDSDVVLWAIHSDSRSVQFDQQSLDTLLGTNDEVRTLLMSKIVFVLTKVDLILPEVEPDRPAVEPWVYARQGRRGKFTPQARLVDTLAKKEQYFADAFITPNAPHIVARTFNDSGLRAQATSAILADEDTVEYHGSMTREKVVTLSARYPQHEMIFERLYDAYRVIPCSARFRYNLTQLMVQIVNRLGPGAIERFKRFAGNDDLNFVDFAIAKTLSNIVVLDEARDQIEFDLRSQKFVGE